MTDVIQCIICNPVAEMAKEGRCMTPRHLWAYGYACAVETILCEKAYPLCPGCRSCLDRLLETRGVKIVPMANILPIEEVPS